MDLPVQRPRDLEKKIEKDCHGALTEPVGGVDSD